MGNNRGMRRVVVITTGGTIATSSGADGVARPVLSGAELLSGIGVAAAREVASGIDTEIVDVMSVDSSRLVPADWDVIGAAISAAVAGGADGIVVTHGTDTLEETALWLAATYSASAPVVLTGAMRSSDHPEPDGPRNLAEAVAVAADPGATGAGVLVAFAGTVYAPLGLTKCGSGWIGDAIGGVEGAGPPVVRLTRTGRRPYLGAAAAATAPRVDVVAVYAGADAVALKACADAGARGIVLEALGAGNVPDAVLDGVRRLRGDRIEVAVSTRVPGTTVSARYGPGRDLVDVGAVVVPTLRPAQARVLMMAALALGSPVADVLARWG